VDLIAIARFARREELILDVVGQLEIRCDALDDFFGAS
jgi:hypothetical protein